MRPRKTEDEKAYNTLLRTEKKGRTDAPRLCSLCEKSLPVSGPYVMVVLSTTEYPRIGLGCGHSLQEVIQATQDFAKKGGGR